MIISPPAIDAALSAPPATDTASGVLDGHRRSRSDNIQTALIQANSSASGHHHPTTWSDNEGDSSSTNKSSLTDKLASVDTSGYVIEYTSEFY